MGGEGGEILCETRLNDLPWRLEMLFTKGFNLNLFMLV